MLNRISIFFPLMISKYHRQTDQYHLLFSKGHHFFYKINYYKFCIVIFNKSFKSKLICNTHTHTHTHTHTVHLQSYCPIKPRRDIKIAENYCRKNATTLSKCLYLHCLL
jgi:hypothetical protein